MKTLIFNGSPHKNGETAKMIDYVMRNNACEVMRVDTYHSHISPCIDCRKCRNSVACAIDDEMTEIYGYIKDCDRIILASPLYFSTLTGSLLGVMSRLQMFCTQKYINKQPVPILPKKGLVLLSGGGSTKNTVGVEQTCRILMRDLNVTEYKTVMYLNTDSCSVAEDVQALTALDEARKFFIN